MGFFSKTYKHKCPDGSIKIIHKNIDDAFPLAVKDVETNSKGGLEAKDIASLNVSTDYKSKIQGLVYCLNDLNQDLMILFRSAYIAYQADPCNDKGFFQRQIDGIIMDQKRMTTLRLQIRGFISLAEKNPNHGEVMKAYLQIINSMGINSGEAAAIAVSENREAADRWIGGEHGG